MTLQRNKQILLSNADEYIWIVLPLSLPYVIALALDS